MKINIMPCRYPLKETEWPARLKAGVESHGDKAMFSHTVNTADVHAFWGMRRSWGKTAIARGCRSLVVERAYLGDRFKWHAMGFDGLNGFADFCTDDVPDDRWRKYWRDDVVDWKQGGDYALVIGQVPGDAALRGIDILSWAQDIAEQATKFYGKVLFRPHPMARRRMVLQGFDCHLGSLDEALANAAVVITYNSNAAVDAVMAGVPAIAVDRGSMAWDVASHDLESPLYVGDRDDWGRRLAYSQWLPDEISNGAAWAHLRGFV